MAEGPCPMCDEAVVWDFVPLFTGDGPLRAHRTCMLREVIGGIGHLIAHDYWCTERRDPDAGLTYRQSAQLVDAYVRAVGVDRTTETRSQDERNHMSETTTTPETRTDVPTDVHARRIEEMARTIVALRNDLDTIAEALRDESIDRGWCSEYGSFIDRVNARCSEPWLKPCRQAGRLRLMVEIEFEAANVTDARDDLVGQIKEIELGAAEGTVNGIEVMLDVMPSARSQAPSNGSEDAAPAVAPDVV